MSAITILRDRDHFHHHSQHQPHLRDHHNHTHPSFSSTLLEKIYRSFDEERETRRSSSDTYSRIKMTTTTKTTKKNNNNNNSSSYLERENRFAIDKWMENEKLNLRRSAQFDSRSLRRPMNHSSSTSSSDSSSGIGAFSSSDTESLYGYSAPKPSKQKQNSPPLKPIRTTTEFHRKVYSDEIPATSNNNKKKEGNLQRRALKLYGDLKKVKQPISPGGRLATFLNSLFNAKKAKTSSSSPSTSASSPSISSISHKLGRDLYSASTPSTASLSCLSKTPSSAGRIQSRSVRFVDDNERGYRRNGTSDVTKRDWSTLANDEEFKLQIREKQRRVEEVAKELWKINNNNYHNRKELTVNIIPDNNNNSRKFHNDVIIPGFEIDDEEADDDDEASCCSSDLFELENLLDVGVVDRYREELPVYETTHVGTNRAIANGLIL